MMNEETIDWRAVDKTRNKMSVEEYTKILEETRRCREAQNWIKYAKDRMASVTFIPFKKDELLIDVWKDSCVIQDSLTAANKSITEIIHQLRDRLPKNGCELSALYNQMLAMEGKDDEDDEEEDE
tara:strand:+ start:365 stop:739 length:375 start_codon:yes stop_codon:yes gene_type:complete